MKTWMFLLIAGVLFAQERASMWGGGIEWGTKQSEDGLNISGIQTAINGTDTLYSKALPIEENTEGIYTIFAYWEYTDAASDSVELEGRYGIRMSDYPDALVVKWTSWGSLMDLKSTNTLEQLNIAQADSSWWSPYNFRQYRTYRRDTETVDTCTVYITDFVR